MPTKKNRAEYMRNRRAAFRAAGRCVVCGKEPVAGRTLCAPHAAYQAEANRAYFKRLRDAYHGG